MRFPERFILGTIFLIFMAGCGDSEDTPDVPREPNPLAARAHLPVKAMLQNVQFMSTETGENGTKPGPIADGHEILTFGAGCVRLEHGDRMEWMDLVFDEDGAFTSIRHEDGLRLSGRFNRESGTVIWRGKEYGLMSSAEDAGVSDPPALEKMENGIRIDLSSRRSEYMRHDIPEGSLSVQTHGHLGDKCVFDYTWEVEGSYSVYRHALEISKKSATITCERSSIGPRLEVSFNMSESTPVYSGNLFSGRKTLNRPWFTREVWGSNLTVKTMDLVEGTGPRLKDDAKVTFRCVVYTDDKCDLRKAGFEKPKQLEFPFSNTGKHPGLSAAIRYMRAGAWRRATIPGSIAGPLKGNGFIIFDVNLVKIE